MFTVGLVRLFALITLTVLHIYKTAVCSGFNFIRNLLAISFL